MIDTLPLISVIIPAYNASSFLEIAVESIVSQTYRNIEIIIVDDGSKDNTFEKALLLSEKHKNIKAITQTNSKQGIARNNGISNANGEYVAFLDADDEWLPNKIEIQLNYLFAYKADMVFTDGYLFITDKKIALAEIYKTTESPIEIEASKGIISGANGIKLLHIKNRIPTSSVLCKKSVIVNAGLFTTNPELQNCEDYLLWFNLVKQGCKLIGIPEKLFLYRVHPNSSTSGIKNIMFPLIKSIYEMGLPLTQEQKTQIVKNSKILFEDLFPRGEIILAKVIMEKYAENAAFGLSKFLMKLSLSLNLYRVFLSLFYREARPLFAKQLDESNLLIPLEQEIILK
jgi:teichuronic acid biosynthesis glycosyltransferase TuaG